MFSGTIRSNLQLGVEKTLTDAELEEALCLDFINEMPDRFDTDLGAVGKAVLGGQKQRLALSQSIDPPSGRGDECVGQRESGEDLDGIDGVERESSVSDGTSFEHDCRYHLHGSRWCDSGSGNT